MRSGSGSSEEPEIYSVVLSVVWAAGSVASVVTSPVGSVISGSVSVCSVVVMSGFSVVCS